MVPLMVGVVSSVVAPSAIGPVMVPTLSLMTVMTTGLTGGSPGVMDEVMRYWPMLP